MDYRGIITRGYHVDTGGQTAIRIISQGYVGVLATLQQIFNIVERTIYFQVVKIKSVMYGVAQPADAKFTINKTEEGLF